MSNDSWNWWNLILCYPLYGCVRKIRGYFTLSIPNWGECNCGNCSILFEQCPVGFMLFRRSTGHSRIGFAIRGLSMVGIHGRKGWLKCVEHWNLCGEHLVPHVEPLNLGDTRLPKLSNHQDMKIKSRRCSAMCENQWGWGLRTLAMLLNSNLFGHKKRNQIHKFCKLFFCSRTQHIKLGPLSQYSCFREVIMKLRNLYGSDFFFCPAPTLGYIHVWFSDTLLGCHWLSYHPKHPRPSKYPIPRIPWVITNECRSLSLLCGTKAGAFLEYLRPNIKHLPETN